jgi:diguanylate cyclase (GGDEF)-like protein
MGLLVVMALLLFNILYILNLNHHLREIKLRLEASNDELRRLSSHDGLTGVANHRLFEERLASEWARAARDQTPLSLIMADIDHFKLLNDSDGHLFGDVCLKQVAQALDQQVRRPADLLARYGGEEFIAILPGVDAPGALTLAERMREAVEELRLSNHGTGGGPVTVSLGVASTIPRPGTSATEFVARADHAMYQAKEAGRNQTRLAA